MIHDVRLLLACGFVLTLCLAGCGRDGLAQISGMVVFDGQPLGKGNVSFMPADGRGPTAAAIVADGKYSVRIAPGKKRVQIEGFRVVGRQHAMGDPNAPMVDILKPIIPKRYNIDSELTCEITANNHTYDFRLQK